MAISPPTPLPRPDISISTSNPSIPNTAPIADGPRKIGVVISRGSSSRKYEVEGSTESERIREVVRQITDDPYTAEWLP